MKTQCRVEVETAEFYATRDKVEARLNSPEFENLVNDYMIDEMQRVAGNPDYLWEAVGPDAVSNDRMGMIEDAMAASILNGDSAELGRIIFEFARGYLEGIARECAEYKAQRKIESDI